MAHFINDGFLIWITLADKYKDAVLKKNPNVFAELYQKAREMKEVKYTYYHGRCSKPQQKIELQFLRKDLQTIMTLLEEHMSTYDDIEDVYELLKIEALESKHDELIAEYIEIYTERKIEEVFAILENRLEKREREKRQEELAKLPPDQFDFPVAFSPEMRTYIEELRHVMKNLDSVGSIGQIFSKKLLISIDDGWGYSAFLRAIRAELVRYYDDNGTEMKIEEVTLPLNNGIDVLKSQADKVKDVSEDRVKYNRFSILSYDMREWVDEFSKSDVLNEIRRIGQYAKNILVVFRIPYMDMKRVKDIEQNMSNVVSLRSIVIPPVTSENMVVYLKDKLKEARFLADTDCDDILEQWICQEKNEGNFFGYKTLDKMAGELIYHKALCSDLNETSENDIKQIHVADVKPMVSNVLEDEDAYELLNELIGITQVKARVREIVAQIKLQKTLESQGKKIEKPSMHMLFLGNPGTGKTTVARIVGQIFRQEGILKKGFFYEKAGNDFVARYVGTAAQAIRTACRDAYGSVLFIDEAYGMNVTTMKGTVADETIPVLVAEMENHRGDLCVILAGYQEEMAEFLKINSGLASRIPHVIEFPNYTKDELLQIFLQMLDKSFTYEDELLEAVTEYIQNIPKEQYDTKEFSNARFIRNLFEHLWGKAAYRMSLSGEKDVILKKEDWVNVLVEENFNNMVEEKPKRTIGFKPV